MWKRISRMIRTAGIAIALLPFTAAADAQSPAPRPLSLREATEMALGNSPDLAIARAAVQASGFELTAARGAYDPALKFSSFFDRSRTPITDLFSASRSGGPAIASSGITQSARFEGLSRWGGGRYGVEFASGRETTSNLFSAFGRFNRTSLSVSYTQPLWRGRAYDAPRRQLDIARRNADLTDAMFRQRVIGLVVAVQTSYWELAFAQQRLATQRAILVDAETQLASTRRQAQQGLLAASDISAAEAQVARFEGDLHRAEEAVSRAQNALKTLLAPIWNETVTPTDPELSIDALPAPAEAMDLALAHRPEFRQLDANVAINQARLRDAREQTRPQADLTVSYSLNGLAGRLNPGAGADAGNLFVSPPPAQLAGGFGNALAGMFRNRFNELRVGVTIAFPLRNRTAKGELGQTLAENDRLTAERRKLAIAIQAEVRDALQAVQSAEARQQAAARAKRAAEREYESERRRFAGGIEEASLFLLLEKQRQTAAAALDLLRTRIEQRQTWIELQRATGTLLQRNEIRLVAALAK